MHATRRAVFAIALACCSWLNIALGEPLVLADTERLLPIVIGAQPSERLLLAATELQAFFARMSGRKPPILSDAEVASGPMISLGTTRHLTAKIAEQIPQDVPGGEGFIITSDAGSLFVAGGSDQGTLWGVYALLEHFGCRFYLPGADGTLVPQHRVLALEQGFRLLDQPDFMYRKPWYDRFVTQSDPERAAINTWQRRNRRGGVHGYVGHAWHEIIPAQEFNTHPELFGFYQGRRQPLQLCISNPEVVRRAVRYVDAQFRSDPEFLFASLSPNDGQGFCQSPETLALASDLSGQILVFVNRVAQAIQPHWPDRLLAFYAYAYNIEPPADPTLRAADNVMVWIAHHGFDQINVINETTEPGQIRFRRIVQEWRRRARHIGTQEYASWWPVLEVNYRALAANRRFYHQHGSRSIATEYLARGFGSDLYMYLELRLLWDIDADAEHIIDEFTTRYYASQAKAVRAVYRDLEQMVRSRGRDTASAGDLPEMLRLVDPAILDRSLAHLQSARRNAANPVEAGRIERAYKTLEVSRWIVQHYLDRDAYRRQPNAETRATTRQTTTTAMTLARALAGKNLISSQFQQRAAAALAQLDRDPTTFTETGVFVYSDDVNMGGNALIDAREVRGLNIGSYGLESGPGQSGFIVYEFSAPPGAVFQSGELYDLFINPRANKRLSNVISFSTDGGVTFRDWSRDTPYHGYQRTYDISSFISGAPRFQLRFEFQNNSEQSLLAFDNWGIRGVTR